VDPEFGKLEKCEAELTKVPENGHFLQPEGGMEPAILANRNSVIVWFYGIFTEAQ
jgi:hypothetical protein